VPRLNVLAIIILIILSENARAREDFLSKKLAGGDGDKGLSVKGLFPLSLSVILSTFLFFSIAPGL
jgi:hypothetical protein